jgi:hypothetical protein
LEVFFILFLVHFQFPSSFLVRSVFVPIWVLVSIVRSIVFRFSYSALLHCHKMCSSVSFCAAKRAGFLPFCNGVWAYCNEYLIGLPPPDRAFSASQCHFANPCSSFSLSLHSPLLSTFFVGCSPFPS